MRGPLISIFVCCSLLWTGALAQRHHFSRFSTREGLSNNCINDIVEDPSGFIWVATSDGLNRYDGHRFEVFRSQDSPGSLHSNQIQTLMLDRKGRLWMGGTGWTVINVFDPGTNAFSSIPIEHHDHSLHVCDLFEDAEGRVWMASSNGLFLFDPSSNTFNDLTTETAVGPKPLGTYSYTNNVFAPDPFGKGFWLVTNRGFNFFSYEEDEFFHANRTTGKKIFNLGVRRPFVIDRSGVLWTSILDQGLYWSWIGYDLAEDSIVYRNDTVTLENERMLNAFSRIALDDRGRVWLGNNARTPLIFNTSERKFDYSLNSVYPGSLTNHTLRATCVDRKGNVWLGTEEGLFASFVIHEFIDTQWIGEWTAFRKPRIKDQYFLNDTILLMVANKLVFAWNTRSRSLATWTPMLKGKPLTEDTRFLAGKDEDHIWLGTFFGLYSMNIHTKQLVDEVELLPESWHRELRVNSSIACLHQDSSGTVLLSTARGLFVFNHEKGLYKQQFWPLGQNPPKIHQIIPKRSGGYWLATGGAMAPSYMTEATDTIQALSLPKELSISPTTILESPNGELWIGSPASGIVRYDPGTGMGKRYTISSGLHSNAVYKILEDKGTIWVITANGIAVYNQISDRFERVCSEYTLPEYFYRDVGEIGPDGRIYSFSQNIFYSLDPAIRHLNSTIAPVTFTSFTHPGNETNFLSGQRIFLRHDENDIGITFSIFNFNPNISVRYEYLLEGSTQEWRAVESPGEIRFNRLPPGEYSLLIRSDNGTGIFSAEYSRLSFTIQPPWYQTWWFQLCALILLVLSIGFAVRLYTIRKFRERERELEKLRLIEEERLRIARDMHDDMGGGLSSIRMISEQALQEKSTDTLPVITGLATELVERMRQIVWALNDENGTVNDLYFYCAAYAREFMRRHNIQVNTSGSPESEIQLSSKQRRNIFLSVKEALHNVVKHSNASQTEMRFSLEGEHLRVIIADNGRGMNITKASGNGLKNMKQRMHDLQGEFRVEEKDGTSVILTIPIRANKS